MAFGLRVAPALDRSIGGLADLSLLSEVAQIRPPPQEWSFLSASKPESCQPRETTALTRVATRHGASDACDSSGMRPSTAGLKP